MKTSSHYGIYGGQYVAETLMTPLAELEEAFLAARNDPAFQEEMNRLPSHIRTWELQGRDSHGASCRDE